MVAGVPQSYMGLFPHPVQGYPILCGGVWGTQFNQGVLLSCMGVPYPDWGTTIQYRATITRAVPVTGLTLPPWAVPVMVLPHAPELW